MLYRWVILSTQCPSKMWCLHFSVQNCNQYFLCCITTHTSDSMSFVSHAKWIVKKSFFYYIIQINFVHANFRVSSGFSRENAWWGNLTTWWEIRILCWDDQTTSNAYANAIILWWSMCSSSLASQSTNLLLLL